MFLKAVSPEACQIMKLDDTNELYAQTCCYRPSIQLRTLSARHRTFLLCCTEFDLNTPR